MPARIVITRAKAADMQVLGSASIPVAVSIGPATALVPRDAARPLGRAGRAAARRAGRPDAHAEEPFDRVARLAAMVLATPQAYVAIAGECPFPGSSRAAVRDLADLESLAELSWCQSVIDSGDKLIINDARLDPRSATRLIEPAGVIAWAGFPVRGPDGRVEGALCVADRLPHYWSTGDVEVLETLAYVASGELAMQVALELGAERAILAQTLQESLLPPRLPGVPGLQVAARYMAGGKEGEVLGDFYDVFPSVPGSWGVAVGDVCGKGVAAAKSTALARYTLRAEAHRETRPSVILAALNRALLDWLTDDPRFLTAIYATVRPTMAGAAIQVSSAGHPLALLLRADGRVQTFGRPGTLLGLLPDPELHDSRALLRAGDSLVLFTDGVTEARSLIDRDLYGDDRLRDLVADLGDMPADQIADAIRRDAAAFSGGDISDDTVVLVLKVPGHAINGSPRPLPA
jgi:phosphoserine phosphatase RsbU/P